MSALGDAHPAFPVSEKNGSNEGMPGMSLRDYFAAKAMAAIIRGANGMTLGADHEGNNRTISNVAYSMADAMLAIRKGGAS